MKPFYVLSVFNYDQNYIEIHEHSLCRLKVAVTYGLIPICGNRNILIFGVKLQVWSNIKINTSKLCMTRAVLGDGEDTSLKEQLFNPRNGIRGQTKTFLRTPVFGSPILSLTLRTQMPT